MKKNKYEVIADEISRRIAENCYDKNKPMPTEMQFADEFSVSRFTIRKALHLLIEKGILYSVRGSGTYIKTKMQKNMYELKSYKERLLLEGSSPISKVLEFRMEKPSKKITDKLQLSAGVNVYYVRRLRFMHEKIVMLEDTWMPVDLFPDLTLSIMEHSKYEYIENQKSFVIDYSMEKYLPIHPPVDIAELLEIAVTTPILKAESVGYLDDGRIFDYSEEYYRSDGHVLHMKAVRKR